MAEYEENVVDPRRAQIRGKVEIVKNLPTLPGITAALTEVMAEPDSSLQDIADIVSKDISLSAKFLKLVNAPFYGFPERIASVQNAVLLVGSNVVRALASSDEVRAAPDRSPVGLWEHSLGVALASRLLADRLDVPDADEVTVAGLLHDLGKLVLYTVLREKATRAYELAAERNELSLEVERQVLGVDHAEVGGWSAENWNFPITLRETISYHHDPGLSEKAALKTAIVHLADLLVHAVGFGRNGSPVPTLDAAAWKVLGLTEGDLKEVVGQLEDKLSITATALYRCA